MEKHYRVIPRDLFNEAKLLKCIGRMSLLIHDRMIPFDGIVKHNDKPFKIKLTDAGNLYIQNVKVYANGKFLDLQTTYNSKSNYPLYLVTEDYCEILVFNEAGEFEEEFINYVKQLE